MTFNSRSLPIASISAMAIAFLLAGCQTSTGAKGAPPAGLAKQDTAFVTVAGSAEKMKAFDTRLRQLLGIGLGDSDTLGCKNCDKLQQGMPVTEVVYIIPRRSAAHFQHIGTAWNDVWYDGTPPFDAAVGVRLTMQFDYNDSPDPSCMSTTTACFTRPTCRLTGYCSQNQTGDCLPACGRP